MHIRCPHCRSPIELVEEGAFDSVTCPSCGSGFNLVGDDATLSHRPPTQRTIAQFELVELLGTGAFGSVWKARDTQLDRQVAVKIPRHSQLAPEDREKFFREARAAAQLRHPNIVSVHEAGREGDVVYIVSDLVEGLTLSDWLTGHQPTSREAAELCAQIAAALQHAHQSGVIHRDLKPSNVMIDREGRPHLMDFGLAKREAGEITMTLDGQVLGTPAYMSPEQARGESHRVDRRTDVYSLGVILFELLTRERPFRGNRRMLLHQLLTDDPPSPRRLNSLVPRDLETICLKCLRKEPAARYPDAEALADDLRRFLRGQPIRARPVGRIAKAAKWSRRNPVLAASMGAILLLLAATAGLAVVARQLEVAKREAVEDALLAEARLSRDLEESLYLNRIALARRDWDDNDLVHLRELLDACPERLRGWEWRYLDRLTRLSARRLKLAPPARGEAVVDMSLAFSAAGELVVIRLLCPEESPANASPPPRPRCLEATAFDTASGAPVSVERLQFGPSERLVALAHRADRLAIARSESLDLFDLSLRRRIRTVATGRQVLDAAFSLDGSEIAVLAADRPSPLLQVWDVAETKLLSETRVSDAIGLAGFRRGRVAILMAPPPEPRAAGGDSRLDELAATLQGMAANKVTVVDAKQNAKLLEVDSIVTFTPGILVTPASGLGWKQCWLTDDGSALIASTSDRGCMIWGFAMERAEPLHLWDGPAAFVDMTSDELLLVPIELGDEMLSFQPSSIIRVWGSDWDLVEKGWRALRGHNASVTAIAVDSGTKAASGSVDRSVRVWDLSQSTKPLVLPGHTAAITALAFDASGSLLASASRSEVKLWDVTRQPEYRELPPTPGEGHEAATLALDNGGRRMAAVFKRLTLELDPPSEVGLYDYPSATLRAALEPVWEMTNDASFSRDGRSLLVATDDHLWSMPLQQDPPPAVKTPGEFLAIAAGGGRFAAVSGGEVVVLDADLNSQLSTGIHADDGIQARFSGGGDLLAVLVEPRSTAAELRLWRLDEGREVMQASASSFVAFSSDSSLVCSGTPDGDVAIWSTADGGKRFRLPVSRLSGRAVSAAFGPGPDRMVTGFNDGTARLWQLSSGRQLLRLEAAAIQKPVHVFVGPDDHQIVTECGGDVRFWIGDPSDRDL